MHLLHAWWRGPFEDLLPQEKSYFPRTSPEGTLVFLGFIFFLLKCGFLLNFLCYISLFFIDSNHRKLNCFSDVKKNKYIEYFKLKSYCRLFHIVRMIIPRVPKWNMISIPRENTTF